MHNKYKKYCTIHNTDTVAYTTHSGSYSTERKKEVHRLHTGTQQLQRYTTSTAVHNTYMTQKHLGYLSDKLMISVLILSSRHFNISVLGVVVRGAKKHYEDRTNLEYFTAKELYSTVEV